MKWNRIGLRIFLRLAQMLSVFLIGYLWTGELATASQVMLMLFVFPYAIGVLAGILLIVAIYLVRRTGWL